MRFLLTTIFFVVALALVPRPAIAQDAGGLRLSTSPLPVNLATKPGSSVSTELRVRNSGSETETLNVGLLKFSADSATGDPLLLNREKGDSYFDWVHFSPSKLTLAPNEWGTVKMTINVPKSAAFGYYYAVTFGRASDTQASAGQSSLRGAAATLVLLEATVPNAKREIKLESFKPARAWYEFLPATFDVGLCNTGNVHAAPFGTLFIEKGDSQIDQIPFNEAKGNILPQSPRVYNVDWSNGFPIYEAKTQDEQVVLDTEGSAKRQLSWDFTNINNLRWGKYTAHLVIAYDNGQRDVPIEASVDFWIIPWRFLGVGLLLLSFFGFGVYMFGRGIWRKIRRR